MIKPLYIIGAGGFGRETAWLVERINKVSPAWDFKGFIDNDNSLWGTIIDRYKVHGGHNVLEKCESDIWCVLATGNAEVRKKGIERLNSFPHIHFATLIDPTVDVNRTVSIGEGSIICAGTIITVDVHIGSHCIINLDCTIGHDIFLENFVTLYPGVYIPGPVKIGDTSELGIDAQTIQDVHIGGSWLIGAGAVAIQNIAFDVTAVGSLAKVIKHQEKPHMCAGEREFFDWTAFHAPPAAIKKQYRWAA